MRCGVCCPLLLVSFSETLTSQAFRQLRMRATTRRCVNRMASSVQSNHDVSETKSSYSLLDEWLSHDSVDFHRFSAQEAGDIRENLLSWYDKNRRKLPWRGDPPPWVGSTVNFGKEDATSKCKQGRIKDYFQPTLNASFSNQSDQKSDDKDLSAFDVTAYGVWVSEIMLQQTRVDAVIPYWVRWMKAFPTVHALATATQEEVNSHWAGLGFYRRARLLHTAAKQIVDNGSKMPSTVDGLLKLPGVGRYTASAIASIAYNVTVPVVDGNVCRVLCRLKGIANDVKAPALKDRTGWDLADDLVRAGDGSRPGDLNQALMELGATYCAPSGTGIDPSDPLRDFYYSTRLGREVATRRALGIDAIAGSGCKLCANDGVQNALRSMIGSLEEKKSNDQSFSDFASECGHKAFPLPPKKLAKREEVLVVAALSCKLGNETAWLLTRRSDNGLLAGQWEFPSSVVWKREAETLKKRKTQDQTNEIPLIPTRERKDALDELLNKFGPGEAPSLDRDHSHLLTRRRCLKSPIEHVFSHVRHTMWVEYAEIEEAYPFDDVVGSPADGSARWMTESDMYRVGVTAGVKKILETVLKASTKPRNTRTTKRRRTK